ncbi:hypothetical protein HD806DRAFT_533136 [Xylariaceae sp. AK1471]|nr:hypothetical protein HD806DRAFT_533136 [Xylariaceae sp. AK1471]
MDEDPSATTRDTIGELINDYIATLDQVCKDYAKELHILFPRDSPLREASINLVCNKLMEVESLHLETLLGTAKLELQMKEPVAQRLLNGISSPASETHPSTKTVMTTKFQDHPRRYTASKRPRREMSASTDGLHHPSKRARVSISDTDDNSNLDDTSDEDLGDNKSEYQEEGEEEGESEEREEVMSKPEIIPAGSSFPKSTTMTEVAERNEFVIEWPAKSGVYRVVRCRLCPQHSFRYSPWRNTGSYTQHWKRSLKHRELGRTVFDLKTVLRDDTILVEGADNRWAQKHNKRKPRRRHTCPRPTSEHPASIWSQISTTASGSLPSTPSRAGRHVQHKMAKIPPRLRPGSLMPGRQEKGYVEATFACENGVLTTPSKSSGNAPVAPMGANIVVLDFTGDAATE